MLIKESDQQEILLYAFRYSLGRSTYAPHTIVRILRNNWHRFSLAHRELFIKEILEAKARYRLGHWTDKKAWMTIVELEAEEKQ